MESLPLALREAWGTVQGPMRAVRPVEAERMLVPEVAALEQAVVAEERAEEEELQALALPRYIPQLRPLPGWGI